MRLIALILLVSLLPTLTLATCPTICGEDGEWHTCEDVEAAPDTECVERGDFITAGKSPADVVTAANLAAHVQAEEGVAFTGMTFDEVAEKEAAWFEERTVIYLDEDEAKLMVGGSAPPIHDRVADTAKAWLEAQGLSASYGMPVDETVTPPIDEAPTEARSEPTPETPPEEAEAAEQPVEPPAKETNEGAEEAPAQAGPPMPPGMDEPGEESAEEADMEKDGAGEETGQDDSNVIVRVWRWFTSLF